MSTSISIHLMLLFNPTADVINVFNLNFNTSNVTIQLIWTSESHLVRDISIHLMLLFNVLQALTLI